MLDLHRGASSESDASVSLVCLPGKVQECGKNVAMISPPSDSQPSTFYKGCSLRSSLKLRRCHSEDACTCPQNCSKVDHGGLLPCCLSSFDLYDILGSGLSGTMNATRFRHLAPASHVCQTLGQCMTLTSGMLFRFVAFSSGSPAQCKPR